MKNIFLFLFYIVSINCYSQKHEFEEDTRDFEIVNLTKSQFIDNNERNRNLIVYELAGEIKNVSGKTIVESSLNSSLKITFGSQTLYLGDTYNKTGGYDTEVSPQNPFKNNQVKKFHLKLVEPQFNQAYKDYSGLASFQIRIVAKALFDYDIADFIIYKNTSKQDVTDKWNLFRMGKDQNNISELNKLRDEKDSKLKRDNELKIHIQDSITNSLKDGMIKIGDDFFKNKEYKEAYNQYLSAFKQFPSDSLLSQKVNQAQDILHKIQIEQLEIQKKQYKLYLDKGDEFMTLSKYDDALVNYKLANQYQNTVEIEQKIFGCNKMIKENEAKRKELLYSNSLLEADSVAKLGDYKNTQTWLNYALSNSNAYIPHLDKRYIDRRDLYEQFTEKVKLFNINNAGISNSNIKTEKIEVYNAYNQLLTELYLKRDIFEYDRYLRKLIRTQDNILKNIIPASNRKTKSLAKDLKVATSNSQIQELLTNYVAE